MAGMLAFKERAGDCQQKSAGRSRQLTLDNLAGSLTKGEREFPLPDPAIAQACEIHRPPQAASAMAWASTAYANEESPFASLTRRWCLGEWMAAS